MAIYTQYGGEVEIIGAKTLPTEHGDALVFDVRRLSDGKVFTGTGLLNLKADGGIAEINKAIEKYGAQC
jgi:hypothetical protein